MDVPSTITEAFALLDECPADQDQAIVLHVARRPNEKSTDGNLTDDTTGINSVAAAGVAALVALGFPTELGFYARDTHDDTFVCGNATDFDEVPEP